MADGGNIFVYLGGDQEVPLDVVRVVIDRSVKIIPERAFQNRIELVSVKLHDGVEVIEKYAFRGCKSLRRLQLAGVREVGCLAFYGCFALPEVEFGDKLEIIGVNTFRDCRSLRKIKMPSVRTIEYGAFADCTQLTVVELPGVERVEIHAFAFNNCRNLTTVDLVGGIRNTVTSLLLQRWTDVMNSEIDRINQVLPNAHAIEKTAVIDQRIRTVLRRMEHFKAEHNKLLKEATTLLELAIWKAKLDEKEDCSIEGRAKKATNIVDTAGARNERRITSGANIVITNVIPFLHLDE